MNFSKDWTYFRDAYPEDFNDYSVIDIIYNDGTDGGRWRWTKEEGVTELESRLNYDTFPMLWRYNHEWVIKTIVENQFK